MIHEKFVSLIRTGNDVNTALNAVGLSPVHRPCCRNMLMTFPDSGEVQQSHRQHSMKIPHVERTSSCTFTRVVDPK